MSISRLTEGESPSARDLGPIFVESVGNHAGHESVEKAIGSEVRMVTPQLNELGEEEGTCVATDFRGKDLHG